MGRALALIPCIGFRFFWELELEPVWRHGDSKEVRSQKAFDSLSDEPGITVSTSLTGTLNQADGPPSNEFTRGSDVSIFADIIRGHRGKKEATVEYLDGSEIVAIEMLETLFLDV